MDKAAVVAPVDQVYPVPPDAVRLTLPPLQKVVAPDGTMLAVGAVESVTVFDAVAEHVPFETVTV